MVARAGGAGGGAGGVGENREMQQRRAGAGFGSAFPRATRRRAATAAMRCKSALYLGGYLQAGNPNRRQRKKGCFLWGFMDIAPATPRPLLGAPLYY